MGDWLRRLLRRFGRATPVARPAGRDRVDLGAIDTRLMDVEQTQQEIDARLRLLEQQSDPRGWRRHG